MKVEIYINPNGEAHMCLGHTSCSVPMKTVVTMVTSKGKWPKLTVDPKDGNPKFVIEKFATRKGQEPLIRISRDGDFRLLSFTQLTQYVIPELYDGQLRYSVEVD